MSAGRRQPRCAYCGRYVQSGDAARAPVACFVHRDLLALDPSSDRAAAAELGRQAGVLAMAETRRYRLAPSRRKRSR